VKFENMFKIGGKANTSDPDPRKLHRCADSRFLGASSSNSSPVAYPGLHSGGINLTRVVYLPGSEFVALALRPDPLDVQFLCMAISGVHPFGYALPGAPPLDLAGGLAS